jgi:oxygen-independent coproporphyrinogen-3 oxidase
MAQDCELTIESHPNTLDYDKLSRYADIGVNRLSIGTQSFVERKLQMIGRHNSVSQNERVIRDAKAVGISKLSIDLMYRLPHETVEELEVDLAKVCEFRPSNVSCYSLIVEGTGLQRALPTLPTVRTESQMFARIKETLTSHGYEQWSTADFCLPGGVTRYNLNYWRAPQTLLIGLGAGAHTHYFGGYTWANVYSVSEYIDAVSADCFPGIIGQPVPTRELMHRYVVLGAHCLSIDKAPFSRLFDVEITDIFTRELSEMSSHGWIRETDDQIHVTASGELYVNNIAKSFFSQACRGEVQPWSKALKRLRSAEYVPIKSDNQKAPHREASYSESMTG